MRRLALVVALLVLTCSPPLPGIGQSQVDTTAPPICIVGTRLTRTGQPTDTLNVAYALRPLPDRLDSVHVWTTLVKADCDLHVLAAPYLLRPRAYSDVCMQATSRTEARAPR